MSDEVAGEALSEHGAGGAEERIRSVVKDCVHCGFCLPACPTYSLWGEEMDSPRGRIYLVGQLLDGAPLTPAAGEHFDRCLGCMACMTACPSGVQYDQIIAAAREWTEDGSNPFAGSAEAGDVGLAEAAPAGADAGADGASGDSASGDSASGQGASGEGAVAGGGARAGAAAGGRAAATAPRSVSDRVTRGSIFALFPYPKRLRVATAPLRLLQKTGADRLIARTGLVGRVSPAAGQALRLAPPAARPMPPGRFPERVAARGERRAVVGMLTGCVQSVFFPRVNAATARVLAAEGCDVIIPRSQGCCGALSLHSGRAAEAVRFAQRTIETFEAARVDVIVVNSAGCGSAMKEYELLFADFPEWSARAAALSAKVRDLAEFLDSLGPAAERHPVEVVAAYHDACHLGHAQRITAAPRALLRGIPGLELVELRDAGVCCGSAGVYNLLQPQAAQELGSWKADSVVASGASLLISANPGCTLQISSELSARGVALRTAHTAEVLDASINGVALG
jgi:glycolate oxidase iron-sulfur subunit